ncbi:hypothetical protein [Bradyrhizobium sp. USDA 4353]
MIEAQAEPVVFTLISAHHLAAAKLKFLESAAAKHRGPCDSRKLLDLERTIEQAAEDEHRALCELIGCVPMTLTGVGAELRYLHGIVRSNPDRFDSELTAELLQSLIKATEHMRRR